MQGYLFEFERSTRNLSQSGSNEQGADQKFRGIFRLKSKIKTFFLPKTGDLEKKSVLKIFFQSISQKKRSSKKFFRRSRKKTVFKNIFQAIYKILTIQKIVLSSSRGQGNIRELGASRPRTSKCVLEDSTSVTYIQRLEFC